MVQIPFSKPVDWQNFSIQSSITHANLALDNNGEMLVQPVVLVDPAGALLEPKYQFLNEVQRWDNGVPGQVEPLRTPTTFKHHGGDVGNTDEWTPAAGKKVRILGGNFILSKEATCAGAFTVFLRDNATTIFEIDVSNAALTAIGSVTFIPFNFPQNGYLSALADNVIKIATSASLTAGTFSVNLWGTEE